MSGNRAIRCINAALLMLMSHVSMSQCIMINEIMINPAGPFDGSNTPNTSEWLELYNSCTTPVDIGCFVLTDDDFTITIPAGTIIPANGYFTLGSNNAGFAVDLNWATCGCTTNTAEVGIFSNNAEQVILIDDQGNLVNGVYWGAGQFPIDLSSASPTGCLSQDIFFNAPLPAFELLPVPGAQGCSISRQCNGEWAETCSPEDTPGDENTSPQPVVNFSVSSGDICAGECINFTDLSVGASSWEWTFYGAEQTSSTDPNPAQICYSTGGSYGVELTITTVCGISSIYFPNLINVSDNTIPVISPAGPLTICEGENVDLSTTAAGSLQWYMDGIILIGENASTITVTQSGDYTVETISTNCTVESDPVSVDVVVLDPPAITPAGPLTFCAGESAALSCSGLYNSYQWLQNGSEITGATINTFTATESGNYSIEVSDGICAVVSEVTNVVINAPVDAAIDQTGPVEACDYENLVLTSSGVYDSYQWYINGSAIDGATGSDLLITTGGSYSLEVSVDGCAETSAEVIVNILPSPVLSVDPSTDISTCLESAVITANTTGDIQWLLDGAPIAGETNGTILAVADGQYSFISDIDDQCALTSDIIDVNLNVPLLLNIQSSADTLCEGETAELVATGNFDAIIWNNGLTEATIMVDQSGSYVATATSGTCNAMDTAVVFFAPFPVVDAGPDFYSSCEENLELFGNSDSSSFWEVNGFFAAEGDTVVIDRPDKTTEYVLISESNGCISRDTVIVTIDCIFVYAPSAVTPNEDGLNDVFRVHVEGVEKYILRIYNRWGDVIFETDNPDKVWTCGAPDYYVPDGVYIWQIEALDNTLNSILDKDHSRGTVTVLR